MVQPSAKRARSEVNGEAMRKCIGRREAYGLVDDAYRSWSTASAYVPFVRSEQVDVAALRDNPSHQLCTQPRPPTREPSRKEPA